MRPLKVVAADDDANNLEILNVILTMAGHRVVLVTTGQAAIEQALATRADVVFMDAVMPGLVDGLEATRQLKATPDFRGIVIVQSANASGIDQQRGLSTGADAYLVKPFKRVDVLAMLDRFADRLETPTAAPPAQQRASSTSE